MIILKLNISKLSADDLKDMPMTIKGLKLKQLQWHKRYYSGDINDLVEWVATIYKKADNNSPIKSINTKEVPVYFDDKIELKSPPVRIKREEVENYVRELQNVIDKFEKEKEQGQNRELGILIEDLVALREKLKDLLEQYKNSDTIPIDKSYTRFGYYTRDGRDHNPEIVLLMGAIGDNKQRLISTYIHEMFHAYYDLCWIEDQHNPKYKKQVDLTYIEEPLTEYAMLKFLEAFGYEDVLEVAQGVRRKQFSPGTCHYGFGYYLWKWEKDGHKPLCDWIECYKKEKFNISEEEKNMFSDPFSKGLYPFGKENYYMRLLWVILTGAKCKQQGSDVSTGGGVKNKRKKARLRGWYL